MTVTKATLKKCLLESTLTEIREIDGKNYSIEAKDAFKARISGIINGEKKKKSKSVKQVIVILIAAVLLSLSIMFTVSAEIRDVISDFFVSTYEKFSVLNINSENESEPSVTYPQSLEQVYIPKYIKDNGYIEIEKDILNTISLFIWANDVSTIDLTQQIVGDGDLDIFLNTEDTHLNRVNLNGKEIIYILRDGLYTVIWVDYGYLFTMGCEEFLGWSEVEKIILSLEPTI